MQVGAGFQQVRGEAVTEHVGIHSLLIPARRAAYWQAWRGGLGIDGLIAAMPTIAGKQPDAGFSTRAPPVRAQFVEQDRAEHHVAILATLAALDVNDHALAVHVADFQASQLGVADSGGVESHEHGAIEGSRSGVDKLRYFFLTENRGQAVAFLRIRSVGNAPRLLERLDEKNRRAHRWLVTEPGDSFCTVKSWAWYSRICRVPRRSGEQWKCCANLSTKRI